MKNIIPQIILILIAIIGAVIGFVVGEWALSQTDFVRPKDVLEYRIGFPFIGAIISLIPGLGISSWAEGKLSKKTK